MVLKTTLILEERVREFLNNKKGVIEDLCVTKKLYLRLRTGKTELNICLIKRY